MLLSTPQGQPVELRKLGYQWDKARKREAVKASIANDDDLVRKIRALYLRDARKRAAQKSESLESVTAASAWRHPHYRAPLRRRPEAQAGGPITLFA